jgi:hypothetical protein
MVINDFNIICIALYPGETDAPLIVDADAVLSFPIPAESFQSISRRYAKVIDAGSSIDHSKFSQGSLLNGLWQLFGVAPVKNLFRFFVIE